MLCDLNILYDPQTIRKNLVLAQELGYNVVALNFIVAGKLKGVQSPFTDALLQDLSALVPNLRILTRVTLVLDEGGQNQSFTGFLTQFDIVAVQPRSEKSLQSAATALDVDLISLDMSARWPFYLKHKTACAAVERGIHMEICYGGATESDARRATIANAMAIIRATRGRGIVLSSGSARISALRAPFDAVNLLTVWGLSSGRARDAIDKTSHAVAVNGLLRRRSSKQAVSELPSSASKRASTEPGPPSKQKKTSA